MPLVIGGVALLAGCGQIPGSGAPLAPPADCMAGAPYRLNGVTYVPMRGAYDRTGIASWYGPGFHGRPTATGQTFDEMGLTAAHASLPLPSVVAVTNLANGRSLAVTVNDRGPFGKGRIIDLSKAAARQLGFEERGTARVRVQVLEKASRKPWGAC